MRKPTTHLLDSLDWPVLTLVWALCIGATALLSRFDAPAAVVALVLGSMAAAVAAVVMRRPPVSEEFMDAVVLPAHKLGRLRDDAEQARKLAWDRCNAAMDAMLQQQAKIRKARKRRDELLRRFRSPDERPDRRLLVLASCGPAYYAVLRERTRLRRRSAVLAAAQNAYREASEFAAQLDVEPGSTSPSPAAPVRETSSRSPSVGPPSPIRRAGRRSKRKGL